LANCLVLPGGLHRSEQVRNLLFREPDSVDTAFNVLSISWLLVGALVVWQARRGPRAWLWSCAWFFVAITIFAGVVSSGPEPDCSIV